METHYNTLDDSIFSTETFSRWLDGTVEMLHHRIVLLPSRDINILQYSRLLYMILVKLDGLFNPLDLCPRRANVTSSPHFNAEIIEP